MADYTASGAGTSAVNQDYSANGTKGGKTAYQGDADSTYWIAYNTTFAGWVISTSPEALLAHNGPHAYSHNDDGDTPPLTGWDVGGQGSSPAPTLSSGGGSAASTLPVTGAG